MRPVDVFGVLSAMAMLTVAPADANSAGPPIIFNGGVGTRLP